MATKKATAVTTSKTTTTQDNPLQAAMNAAMETPAVGADLLQRITASAAELAAAVKTVAQIEEQLDKAKSRVLNLRTQALPQLFDEAGIPGLDLDETTRVERDTEIYCSISEANQAKAAAWLRENNLGSVVKESIFIPIDKGDTERVKTITKLLISNKISFAEKSSVHPQTLKALVKERLAESKPIGSAITYHTQPVVNVKAIKPSSKRRKTF